MRRNITRPGVARRERHQRYAIKNWVGRLSGAPIFVLGCGASLLDYDLRLIEDYFTIGINRVFKKFDPNILFWQDISLWNTEFHALHNTKSLKVCRDIADPRRIYYNFYLKSGEYKFDTTKAHILYGTGNSGAIAVELACSLGAENIILLGFDCKLSSDGKTDFYGNNGFWLDKNNVLKNCNAGLEFIKNQCPVRVISCSNNDFWPKIGLKEAIDLVDSAGRYKLGRSVYSKTLLRG